MKRGIKLSLSSVLDEAPKWIKGVYATDDHGRTCNELSDQACHFCLAGAMEHAGLEMHFTVMAEVIEKLFPRRARGMSPEVIVTSFNDHKRTTFADIRKVIRAYENL